MIGQGEIRGRHVFYAMAGFFGVVFLVNGVMVYFAITSWTGLETDNAYVRGLEYNQVLESASAQDALGWDVQFDVASQGMRAAAINARLAGTDASPLQGLRVEVEIRRPATDSQDQTLALSETAPGLYSGELNLPFAGNWDMRLVARNNNNDVFVVDRRAWIE